MEVARSPLHSPTATETALSAVGRSLCILLKEKEDALHIPLPEPLPKTEAARLLESRSLSILDTFNDRDVATPYTSYATRDFTFVHEDEYGVPSCCSAHEAQLFMEHVILRNAEHWVEVTSSAVEVDEEEGEAIVWIGMKIHDRPDGFMSGMEKVTCFFWRRVDGLGGERRWMWWKHQCLSARLLMTD